MSRVQLALNVDDLDASIAVYTKLFGVIPGKVKPGYANSAITEEQIATTCCLATQDKVWVSGTDGEKREVYAVLASNWYGFRGRQGTAHREGRREHRDGRGKRRPRSGRRQ